jgi:hypothetical protein
VFYLYLFGAWAAGVAAVYLLVRARKGDED